MKMIRVTHPHYIRRVVSLAQFIWSEHYTSIIGRHQVQFMLKKFQSYKAIKMQIQKGSEYFLLKESDKFVGYLCFEYRAKSLFLSKLYIHPNYRGRELAKKALEHIERIALKKRAKKIYLTVNIHNHLALKSYEKLGFSYAGHVVAKIGNGFIMDDFKMNKQIC